jgi:hypothetical protein
MVRSRDIYFLVGLILPRCTSGKRAFFGKSISGILKFDPTCLNCNSTPDDRVERHDINIDLRVLFTISCCKFTVNFITQSCNFKTRQTRSFPTPLTVTIKFTSQNLGGTWPAAARVSPRWIGLEPTCWRMFRRWVRDRCFGFGFHYEAIWTYFRRKCKYKIN